MSIAENITIANQDTRSQKIIGEMTLASINNKLTFPHISTNGFSDDFGAFTHGKVNTGKSVEFFRQFRGEGRDLEDTTAPLLDMTKFAQPVDRLYDFTINKSIILEWSYTADQMQYLNPEAYYNRYIQPKLDNLLQKTDKYHLGKLAGMAVSAQSANNAYFQNINFLIQASGMLETLGIGLAGCVLLTRPLQYSQIEEYLVDRGAESGRPYELITAPFDRVWRDVPVVRSNNLPTLATGTRLSSSTATTSNRLTVAAAEGATMVTISQANGKTVKAGERIVFKDFHFVNESNYDATPVEYEVGVAQDSTAANNVLVVHLDEPFNAGAATTTNDDNDSVSLAAYQTIDSLPVIGSEVQFRGDTDSEHELSILVCKDALAYFNRATPVTTGLRGAIHVDKMSGLELTWEYEGNLKNSATVHKMYSVFDSLLWDPRFGYTFIGKKIS